MKNKFPPTPPYSKTQIRVAKNLEKLINENPKKVLDCLEKINPETNPKK